MNKYCENTPCVKCGCYFISTEYEKYDGGGEFIERKCLKCGYTWKESCLDDKEQK